MLSEHSGPVVGLVIALLLGLGAAACGADESATSDGSKRDDGGEIVEAGKVGVNALRIGDCFDDSDGVAVDGEESVDVLVVDALPCGDEHDYEVFFSGVLDAGDFPGSEETGERVADACVEQFGAFVGVGYDVSNLDIGYIYPTEENWDEGDRSFLCTLFDLAEQKLQGTMKASGY